MSAPVFAAELSALMRDLSERDTSAAEGYTFHRIQEGYSDGIPRAVFVHAHEEPVGSPLGHWPEPLLSLLARLTAALKAANDRANAAEARIRQLQGGSYAGMLDRT